MDHYEGPGLAFPGGNGPNVAVHAARSGAAAAFLGVVGDDPAGRLIGEALRAEGVGTSRLRIVAGPTPVVTVGRDADGEFSCVACPRQLLPMGLEPGDAGWLGAFDAIHLAATARAEALLPALAEAAPVSYDFGREEVGPGHALLPRVAFAVLSRPGMGEAAAARLAAGLARCGPRLVVVSCGPAGVTACLEGEVRREPAAAGAPVDALGAGDALVGHLLARLLAGDELAPALASAARHAVGACRHLGGFGHRKPAAEVLAGR